MSSRGGNAGGTCTVTVVQQSSPITREAIITSTQQQVLMWVPAGVSDGEKGCPASPESLAVAGYNKLPLTLLRAAQAAADYGYGDYTPTAARSACAALETLRAELVKAGYRRA